MAKEWWTMSDACRILGISDRTLRRHIESGKIESKLEGRRRYVLIDGEPMTGHMASQITDANIATSAVLIEQLRSEKENLRQQVEKLQDELKAERERTESERQRSEQAKERSDTIIMQLTRQLEQNQRLLEYHQEPFWRRWFRKKGNREEIN